MYEIIAAYTKYSSISTPRRHNNSSTWRHAGPILVEHFLITTVLVRSNSSPTLPCIFTLFQCYKVACKRWLTHYHSNTTKSPMLYTIMGRHLHFSNICSFSYALHTNRAFIEAPIRGTHIIPHRLSPHLRFVRTSKPCQKQNHSTECQPIFFQVQNQK